jgi:Uma2 family endonuclease
MTHVRVQRRIRRLLEQAAGDAIVESEFGYRAVAEGEYRRADVVLISKTRWEDITPDDYFHGAPDLVIEVLSPSNTAAEMRDKRKLCLANGCAQFWVVDPEQHEVEVSTPDGHSVIYGPGRHIELFFAAGSSLAVDAIFG